MKKRLENLNDFLTRFGILFFALSAIIVSLYYGVERIFNVDFVCTNGDYQNYNVLRRFLDGQVPYRDFANYLGMGVLYLCGPLLKLNNNFAGSLFVTNMMASLLFILLVSVTFYLITGNKVVSAFAGLLFPKLLSSGIIESFIPGYGYYTKVYLELLAYPKNSFRIARIFLAVLICIISLIYISKKEKVEKDIIRNMAATKIGASTIGFIAGLGITWSNDFGFCCIGSIFLIMLILTIADTCQKKENELKWKRFIYFFFGLFFGSFISVFIASRGNFGSWLEFTFGVGNWQYTYFGRMFNDKYSASLITLFTLKQLKRTRIHLIIYFISMMYCLYKLCIGKANDRMILYVFLFTSIVASHVFYILGSGGDGFTEGTYGFVIISFWALITRVALEFNYKWKNNIEKTVIGLSAVFVIYMIIADISLVRQYNQLNIHQDINYISELGGINSDAEAFRQMNNIVGDGTLFSTYATALEDIRNEYQPTGNDYVIHAIGDTRYKEYIENFKSNNYDWVQTTNYNVWPWEIWTSKASWELYKEIYSNYNLNSTHSFWAMWKYAGEDKNVIDCDVTLNVEQINDSTVIITAESDEKRPCYVDITLNWSASKLGNFDSMLALRKLVFVEDEDSMFNENDNGAGYFLKDKGVKNIPIYIEEGKGSVTLKSVPQNALLIQVLDIEVNEVILKQI